MGMSYYKLSFSLWDSWMLIRRIKHHQAPDKTEYYTDASAHVEYTRPAAWERLPLTEEPTNTEYQYSTQL